MEQGVVEVVCDSFSLTINENGLYVVIRSYWDTVLLIDEADIFLEQRTSEKKST